MIKKVVEQQDQPHSSPQTTPPVDLYQTSDIRFVMVEIGKLTVNVERLIQSEAA